MNNQRVIEVAVNIPTPPLKYFVPPDQIPRLALGKRVLAEVRNKIETGIITAINEDSKKEEGLKTIIAVIDDEPILDNKMMEFVQWISNYYHYPLGKIFASGIPKIFFKNPVIKYRIVSRINPLVHRLPSVITERYVNKNLKRDIDLLIREGVIERFFDFKTINREEKQIEDTYTYIDAYSLSNSQQNALSKIKEYIESTRHRVFNLFGVTGSGKTEVYIRAIKEILDRGKEAILIVPEISLTPQLVSRIGSRFSHPISVLHSHLSENERAKRWLDIKRGKTKILIGARSAIFAPFSNLGIIIVDEEHDPSYKQDSLLTYNGRDIACVRGKICGIPVILGSATPSIETFYNTEINKYELLTLPERVTRHDLPKVEIVDMRTEFPLFGEKRFISEKLMSSLTQNLVKNEKTILFLNRRGFSTYLCCPRCGEIEKCPDCSVSLTYHRGEDHLICHYCGKRRKFERICSSCGTIGLLKLGLGTERVEDEIKMVFPEARVGRMDSDTTRKSRSHEAILGRLINGELDILIGTQMITKGLDIPDVTLVGILNADSNLDIPDFRSSERTFQLITQVAGRAGRGENPGKVIVQTSNPEHYSVILGAKQDFLNFYENEKKFRAELFYPPFSRIVLIRVSGTDPKSVSQLAREVAGKIRDYKDELKTNKNIQILGPAPCPISKIEGRERHQIMIKSKNYSDLSLLVSEIKRIKSHENEIKIDFDPQNFM